MQVKGLWHNPQLLMVAHGWLLTNWFLINWLCTKVPDLLISNFLSTIVTVDWNLSDCFFSWFLNWRCQDLEKGSFIGMECSGFGGLNSPNSARILQAEGFAGVTSFLGGVALIEAASIEPYRLPGNFVMPMKLCDFLEALGMFSFFLSWKDEKGCWRHLGSKESWPPIIWAGEFVVDFWVFNI